MCLCLIQCIAPVVACQLTDSFLFLSCAGAAIVSRILDWCLHAGACRLALFIVQFLAAQLIVLSLLVQWTAFPGRCCLGAAPAYFTCFCFCWPVRLVGPCCFILFSLSLSCRLCDLRVSCLWVAACGVTSKYRLCLWPGGSVCVCVCVVVVVSVVGFPPVGSASLRALLSLSREAPHVNWVLCVASRCVVRVRVGSRLPCLTLFFLSVCLRRLALRESGRVGVSSPVSSQSTQLT